jgi:hypothetical protein
MANDGLSADLSLFMEQKGNGAHRTQDTCCERFFSPEESANKYDFTADAVCEIPGEQQMTNNGNKPALVVVGNGMVGQRLLEELVAHKHGYEITVFCEEPRFAYDRVQLSSYFSGATAQDLSLTTQEFFAIHGIRLILDESVERINRENSTVYGSNGTCVCYNALVLPVMSTERWKTLMPYVTLPPAARLAW